MRLIYHNKFEFAEFHKYSGVSPQIKYHYKNSKKLNAAAFFKIPRNAASKLFVFLDKCILLFI